MRPPPSHVPPQLDLTDHDDVAPVVRRFDQAAIPDPLLSETVDQDFAGPVAEHAKTWTVPVAGVLGTLARRAKVAG